MILCHKYVLFSCEPPCKPLRILVLYEPYFSVSAKYQTFETHWPFELLLPALHPILSTTLLSFNWSCYLVTLFTSLYTFCTRVTRSLISSWIRRICFDIRMCEVWQMWNSFIKKTWNNKSCTGWIWKKRQVCGQKLYIQSARHRPLQNIGLWVRKR